MKKQINAILIIIPFLFINCKTDKNKITIQSNNTQNKEKIVKVKELNNKEINDIFTIKVRQSINLINSIKKVFEYKDITGKYYLITSQDKNDNNKSKSIEILIIKQNYKEPLFTLINKIEDSIISKSDITSAEYNIFIWHKFLIIEDIDNDGIIDVIIVYGSKGDNGFDDGRIKHIIIYKDKKIIIKHQNSSLDDERITKIDELFYQLPNSIKKKVFAQMKLIIKNKLSTYNQNALKKIKNSIK